MKKILIIEDEIVLAEMYKEKLDKEGFEVFLTSEIGEGIEIAKKEKPDLILLDILLPRENGVSFLEKIKKEEIKDIPIVAFSNYDDPATKKRAFELGVKEYLIKANYTPGEIVEKIKNYLK
jgi:DNA-binding response OmpR family regulator